MNNEHLPDGLDSFIADCQSETGKPRSLQEIIAERGKILTPSELLTVANREREERSAVSDFERLIQAEQSVGQFRIEQAIRQPVEFKKATEPEFYDGMKGEAPAQEGDLSWAVGGLETDEPPPAIVGAPPNSGRAREPERSFAKVGGGTRASVLDRPFDELMELVGERASTPGARSLAKSLAQASREIGGGL